MEDTLRVITMRNLSLAMYTYDPDSALTIAYDGLQDAKKINFRAGISRMYEMIGIILTKTGNFNKAISYYIENLKIEESLQSQDGIISANNNLGILYVYLHDYENALKSYTKANNLLATFNSKDLEYVTDLRYMINLNTGDVYEKMRQIDSAFLYYNRALSISMQRKNKKSIGVPMLGLGNVYAAMNKLELSLANYRQSLQYLTESNNEDLVCDACLGMAKVFATQQQADSALYYARLGLYFAQKNGFLSKQQDISNFMSTYFSSHSRIDSAYFYLVNANMLKDSLMGIEKMRTAEQLIFDENVRQLELVAKAAADKEERRQQLQHIFIGLLIPGLFLLTVLLARIRIKVKLIRFLGVISLLFLFEYLTLLLHPIVQHITHHTPILEILIFVAIAGLLIPLHHRLEHWMIEMLVRRVQGNDIPHAEIKDEKSSQAPASAHAAAVNQKQLKKKAQFVKK
jgi:tetratricopeptide (TPR) repeat protein